MSARSDRPASKRVTARSRTAYHEAGHAVLSSAINDAPFRVSIRGVGESLGRAGYRMVNRPELLVQAHLAGFAAEDVLVAVLGRGAMSMSTPSGAEATVIVSTSLALRALEGLRKG